MAVKGEVQSENYDVGQWGDDAQHHSVPQLEWQHGVNREDDEEEERHLETEKGIIHQFWLIWYSKSVVIHLMSLGEYLRERWSVTSNSYCITHLSLSFD